MACAAPSPTSRAWRPDAVFRFSGRIFFAALFELKFSVLLKIVVSDFQVFSGFFGPLPLASMDFEVDRRGRTELEDEFREDFFLSGGDARNPCVLRGIAGSMGSILGSFVVVSSIFRRSRGQVGFPIAESWSRSCETPSLD
jgi:hypothetical protein